MLSSLPPLNALRTFESAGRHLSFRKAAAELHVTPAAVSHQIKLLEDHLGVALFRRLTRAIQLTEAGRALLPALSGGFAQLAQAVNGIRGYRSTSTLSICVPPSFASKWLMPRLHDFVKAFRDIDIRVSTSMRLVDPRRPAAPGSISEGRYHDDDVDVGIRFGTGQYPGCRVDKLFDVSFTPLCSPRLQVPSHPLGEPADLRHYPLLHDDLNDISDGWASWARWFAAAGIENLSASRGPHFSQPILGLEAAVDGAGVVLGARELAAVDVAAGRLMAPFPLSVKTGAGYYVVCCEADADDPRIAAFRAWILNEARELRKEKPVKSGRVSPAAKKTTASASSPSCKAS